MDRLIGMAVFVAAIEEGNLVRAPGASAFHHRRQGGMFLRSNRS
jgi:hypothetical protein